MKWTAVVENGVECAEWRVSNRVWKVKRKVEWNMEKRVDARVASGEGCGHWSAESGCGGELRLENGSWSVFVTGSAYRVTCEAFNLRELCVSCLHLAPWTPIRFFAAILHRGFSCSSDRFHSRGFMFIANVVLPGHGTARPEARPYQRSV